MAMNPPLAMDALNLLPKLLGRSRCETDSSYGHIQMDTSSRKNTWFSDDCDYANELSDVTRCLSGSCTCSSACTLVSEPDSEFVAENVERRNPSRDTACSHNDEASGDESVGPDVIERPMARRHTWDGALTNTTSESAVEVEEDSRSNDLGATCAEPGISQEFQLPESMVSSPVCVWVPFSLPVMHMAWAAPYAQHSQYPSPLYQGGWGAAAYPSNTTCVAVGQPSDLNSPYPGPLCQGSWGVAACPSSTTSVAAGQPAASSFAPQPSLYSLPCASPAFGPPSVIAPVQMTTLMLRNIPNNYDPDRMQALLDSEGFAGLYDFVYLPRDFKSRAALGYGFVNFSTPAHALRAYQVFDEFRNWKCNSNKACAVQWSRTQGFDANVEAVRSSPALRKNIAANFKPVLLKNGVPIKFPTAKVAARK
jgi:hypothetical protein